MRIVGRYRQESLIRGITRAGLFSSAAIIDALRQPTGMDIAAVGTGGDPGHAPARAAYEAFGFALLPSARYLKLLD